MDEKRRIPTQARSRKKYQCIVDASKELIGEYGNDAVSMREISKHSGVALASIYQYFPDKNSILQAIMAQYFEEIRVTIIGAMQQSVSIETLLSSFHSGIDAFYLMFKQDPVLAIVWAGLQANPKLCEFDAADSRKNAEIIAEKLCELCPNLERQEAISSTLLIVHMLGATTRLALVLPSPEGDDLISELKKLVNLRINALLG